MNNLSNEDIKQLRAKFEEWRDFYEEPADIANFSMFSNAITAIDELLKYREAQWNKVGYTWDRGISCEIVAADLYEYCSAGIDLYAAPKLDSDNVTDNTPQQFESFSSGSKNG